MSPLFDLKSRVLFEIASEIQYLQLFVQVKNEI